MDQLVAVADALSDPLRVMILDALAAGRDNACCSPSNEDVPGGVCACDLSPQLGGLAASKLAYHLNRLRAAGLLHEQRRGKWVYYSINEATLARFEKEVSRRWGGRGKENGVRASAP